MLLCLPIIGGLYRWGWLAWLVLQRSRQAHLGKEACLPSQTWTQKYSIQKPTRWLKRKPGADYTKFSVLRTLTWMRFCMRVIAMLPTWQLRKTQRHGTANRISRTVRRLTADLVPHHCSRTYTDRISASPQGEHAGKLPYQTLAGRIEAFPPFPPQVTVCNAIAWEVLRQQNITTVAKRHFGAESNWCPLHASAFFRVARLD